MKRGILWLVLLGILMVGLIAGPDLWAAPGQSPERQTVPSPTSPPPTKPPATKPPPTNPPPTNPPPTNPPPTAQATPTPTPTPIPTTRPSTPTVRGGSTTSSSSPTGRATASPTVVTTQGAAMAEGEPVSEYVLTMPFVDSTSEEATSPSPTTLATAETAGDVSGISPLFWGGVGLTVAGLVLLAVWRWRA